MVGLVGFQGTASTSGVHAFYNPEGLLPTAPPVDIGIPDALATISSGPATFARASVADPGDLLANPEALLTQASPDYPGGTVPEYPYRTTTPAALAPGVLSLGTVASEATTRLDATTVSVWARSEVSDVSFLDILKIDSLVTDVTATSDGTEMTLSGGTTITGATVMDQPVIIDADGIRSDPDAKPSGPGGRGAGGPTGASYSGRVWATDLPARHQKARWS